MSYDFTLPNPTLADLEVIDGATHIAFTASGALAVVCESCEEDAVIIDPDDSPDLYAIQGLVAGHLTACDDFHDTRCRECGEDNTGGEGHDGYCGDCADRAEQRGKGGV